MSKRLVIGAALAAIGCAGADTDPNGATEGPPPFSLSPGGTTSSEPDPEMTESGETGTNGSAPSNPATPSEGQNTNNLPIAPTTPPGAGGTGTAPTGANGMTPGNGQMGNGQMGTGMQTPPPPPPRVRPALDCAAAPPALTGGTQTCSSNVGGAADDGQRWYMWASGTGGCITPYPDGAFRATWNNSGDFLARMGLQWNETQTHEQIGTIGADLAFTKTGTGGGYSFIGIYGWSNEPLVEYYIVENSFGNGPAVPYATTQRGTATIDGASYRIYTGTKTNQPSIHGNATFTQVFSVRQTPRQCGHVSISDHFRQWGQMGINLGKMYEARILVEAGGGSGSATFTTAFVSIAND